MLGSAAVWMLLEHLRRARFLQSAQPKGGEGVAVPPRPARQAAVVDDARRDTRTIEPAPPLAATAVNGHAPASAAEVCPPATKVKLYLHPGRALIGEFDLDRFHTQFDVAAARRYPDLNAAETACGDRSAFLAEVRGPLDGHADGAGDRERSALLIRGLRP